MTAPGRATQRQRHLGLSMLGALSALLIATSANAATGWTGPTLVGPVDDCFDVSAAIDATGADHVAASCHDRIRYSTNQTGSWTSTSFSQPSGFADQHPQVAIDGNRIYVAYNRIGFLACGIDHIGVYYRSRLLVGGSWSAASRFGPGGDDLQSFRVVAGRLHLTVYSQFTNHVFYETNATGTLRRYVISDAVGTSSLRVGSDGKARIAYEAATSLRYATFTGSGFSKTTIPGTTAHDRAPLLVLDPSNHAHVVWTREAPEGCSGGGPSPGNGTYYATNAGGSWTPASARRVTSTKGFASLTIDVTSGRRHVLVGGEGGLYYVTSLPGDPWVSQKLSSARSDSVVLRLDQDRGKLLAAFARRSDTGISASVFAFTKP